MTTLYSLRTLSPSHYGLAKFDVDFNLLEMYNLHHEGESWTCDCPSRQVPCKHIRWLPQILAKADTGNFYNPETKKWLDLQGNVISAPPAPLPSIPHEGTEEPDSSVEEQRTLTPQVEGSNPSPAANWRRF